MKPLAIIVVGASAGGVTALTTLVSGLPADLPAAVFVVLHIGEHKSNLPWLLNQNGPLPAKHAIDGEVICAGKIYVAPPDHHLNVEAGLVRITKGPRENLARPAIDPLFRSAAGAYGAKVIGVILTGGLNDGTAGLYAVKSHGGLAVVQDPDEAENSSMPRSALAHVAVDHCLPMAQIAPLLASIVAERGSVTQRNPQPLAKRQVPEMTADFTLARPVAVTCPDCGGALRQEKVGAMAQFRCHIGHRYTAEVMLAAQFLAMERFLESAMRSMGERSELCRLMADKAFVDESEGRQATWLAAMAEAKEQTAPLRELLERTWIHPMADGVKTFAVA